MITGSTSGAEEAGIEMRGHAGDQRSITNIHGSIVEGIAQVNHLVNRVPRLVRLPV